MIRPIALAFVIIAALLWGYAIGYRDAGKTECIAVHYA
jgi:nitrogen fixation-related uncharacterized protein